MSLYDILLGQNSPVAKWGNSNSNTLLGLGTALLSGPRLDLSPVQQGRMADIAVADKQAEEAKQAQQANATRQLFERDAPDLAQLLDTGVPMGEVWGEYMRRKQPVAPTDPTKTVSGRQELGQQYGLQGDDLTRFVLTGSLPGGNQNVRAGVGQPIFGKNKTTGAIEPWQSMTDGTMVNTANPSANPADYDFNPGIAASSRTTGTVDAKTAGAARAALPGAEQMMEITNKAVSEVRNNAKGMNEWFSQWGPRGVYVNPGSEMGKFIAASNPTNAQAFMQARNMLKGGGQITDYEGRRAEDAISRMQAAIDKGDQDQYLRALADFEQAVAEGYAKLKATAEGAYSQGGAAMPGGSGQSGAYTVLGVE